MNEGDESLYGIVAKELSADRRSEALWTKAFALANGEEAATRAMYIRLRVEQLNVRRLSGTSPKVPASVRAADAATGVGVVGAGATEPAHAEPGKTATTATLTTEELYRAAIGPKNQAFYLDYFARADAAGKMLPSWNWPAFFVTGWALYRKMYFWFFALWGGPATLTVIFALADALWLSLITGVGASVAFSVYANALYHNKTKRRIAVSNCMLSDHSRLLDYLRERGGVHKWVPWVFGAIPVVGILAAIALPAYQDYVKRSEHSAAAPASDASQFVPDASPPAANQTAGASTGATVETDAGMAAYLRGDYSEAAKWYRRAADQGDAGAQYNLGVMYAHGQGLPRDYGEATNWYRRAADLGFPPAQYSLGFLYEYGQGVPQDYAEALKWYRRAANKGHALGQKAVGQSYANGKGVPRDEVEAMKWIRMAADQGDAGAQNSIGTFFAHGRGVSPDPVEAAKWYRRAADQGDANAQFNLGEMFHSGEGVSQDYAEALRWYRKAADQDQASAQNNLGSMYAKGKGVPQDYVEALKWFTLAASRYPASAAVERNLAVKNRDGVAGMMMPAQIAEAQKLAREWKPK